MARNSRNRLAYGSVPVLLSVCAFLHLIHLPSSHTTAAATQLDNFLGVTPRYLKQNAYEENNYLRRLHQCTRITDWVRYRASYKTNWS